MTVNAWYKQWMELYKKPKGLTEKSLAMYDEKYNGYIRGSIGHMKLKDVRDVHLQRILNGEAGRSASHVKKLRMLLQEMFKRARQSRLIPYDPAELLSLPTVTKGRRRSITEEERTAILRISQHHRAGLWILTLLYTGMRPGETAALTWLMWILSIMRSTFMPPKKAEAEPSKALRPPPVSGTSQYTPLCSHTSWRPAGNRSHWYSPPRPGLCKTKAA